MATAKKATKTPVRTTAVQVEVYRSKAVGSNWNSTGDLVCDTTGGCLQVRQRSNGYPVAIFAPGQWTTVNVAPI